MITRSQWCAKPATSATPIDTIFGWAVHWEGPTIGIHPEDDYPEIVQGIQAFHMVVNGWNDIAYNFLVDPYGKVYEGRGYGKRSAANGSTWANAHHPAVCYLGGVGDPFTHAAKVAIKELIGTQTALPHSAFFKTACPGDVIRKWLADGMPVETPATTPPQEEDEDMSKFVSEYRWPAGEVVRIDREGRAYCYGLTYRGGIDRVSAEGKKNWTDGEGVVRPVDTSNPEAGYVIHDEDANFKGVFTPTWAAANLK